MRHPPKESRPSPGVTTPGQLGPTSRVFPPRMASFTLTISLTGMPSVMHTTNSSPASAASRMASPAKGGGTKIAETVANGVKYGDFFAGVLEDLAPLARRDAGDDLRAVIEGKLGVPGAKTAGDALDENFGVGFNEDGHRC